MTGDMLGGIAAAVVTVALIVGTIIWSRDD